jgi:hypothetical protein
MKTTASLIERIEEVLTRRYFLHQSSAVTQAVAFIIFNRYSGTLVHAETFEELAKAVNPTIVMDGIKHVKEIVSDFEASVAKALPVA